jgi:hypothetical protein
MLDTTNRLFGCHIVPAGEPTICLSFGLNDELSRPLVHPCTDGHLWNSLNPVGEGRCDLPHTNGHIERWRCFFARIILDLLAVITLVACVVACAGRHKATKSLAGRLPWHIDLHAYRIVLWWQ